MVTELSTGVNELPISLIPTTSSSSVATNAAPRVRVDPLKLNAFVCCFTPLIVTIKVCSLGGVHPMSCVAEVEEVTFEDLDVTSFSIYLS